VGTEIDWCPRHKPEKLELKDRILKIEHTRGAEVMHLEIRIVSLVMYCALSKYEDRLESKELLRIQPRSCFIVPDQSFGVLSRV